MQTAPVSPRDPPATSTWPELNFVEPAARGGASASTASSISPVSGIGRRAVGDADRRDVQLAGEALAGRDPVADLRGVERDRRVRFDRGSLDLAVRGVDARGDVGGDDESRSGVDRLDRARRGIARLPREARSEDRVDDHRGALQGGRRARRPPPPGRRRAGRGSPWRRPRDRRPARAGACPPRSRCPPGAAPRPGRRRRCCPSHIRRRSCPSRPAPRRPSPRPRRPPPSGPAREPRGPRSPRSRPPASARHQGRG